ncbi:MAG: potassium transporter KtrB [Lachnospiraceae bacterium]|nr:potassium transporter KtrB [Lachnospiraceae bacterium]
MLSKREQNNIVKDNEKLGYLDKLSSTQLIIYGFLLLILVGTVLLMLPISWAEGYEISLVDALFTSTTSVCVTGLTTVTTASAWSTFGQVVILCLIQVGGLGIITVITMTMLLLRQRISLKERIFIQESYNLQTLSGMIIFIKRIIKGTFIVEGIGAIFYAIRYVPRFGFKKGVFAAVFNSVSAFCNAGMDIVGETSLEAYATDPIINGVTMVLIILGGIGFVVWFDVIDTYKSIKSEGGKLRRIFSRLTLHSKLAIWVTFVLLFSGTVLFLAFEYNNPQTIGNMNLFEKIQASTFQSVTTRTAGFLTIPQQNFRAASTIISILLMFIGGSPTGTAGGVKTTTVAMVILTVFSVAKGNQETEVFKRRISSENIRSGLAVIVFALFIVIGGIIGLSITEDADIIDITFEVVSAIATVGLTRGITASLTIIGKLIIIVIMYLGRIGAITLAFAFLIKKNNLNSVRELPEKKIIVC